MKSVMKALRGLLFLVVVLSACCPAPQAGASSNVGTETAFVAQVLELHQDSLLVRLETPPNTVLSVDASLPAAAVGTRVYVRGLLSSTGVTRAEVSVLAAHD